MTGPLTSADRPSGSSGTESEASGSRPTAGGGGPRRRLPTRWRGHQLYWPLVALLVAGLALRLYVMLVYSSVVTTYFTGDATRFLRVGYEGLFYDEWQPAGYAAFLGAMRAVAQDLDVTIVVQHVFGIATALLLYAAARRAGAPRPWALVPAAFVLLSGDHLVFEHAILLETPWVLVLAGATYCAVRAAADHNLRWLAACSALLGLSAIVRNVSLLVPLIVATWAFVVLAKHWRGRLQAAGAGLAPALLVVMAYSLVANAAGPYSGLGEMSGWSLYGRVGQFADCKEFDPPRGTRGLCESRPPGERPGSFYYYFGGPDIPARKVFPALTPEDGEFAGRFARAAILGQPLAYARTVAKDVARYFDPQAGFDRDYSGSGPEAMTFHRVSPDPVNSAVYVGNIERKYSGVDPSPEGGTGLLETYQRVFRLNGMLLFTLVALAFVGLLRARGVARRVCGLLVPVGLFLLVLPPAIWAFEARYAVPPAMLLTIPAAMGAAALTGGRRHAAAVEHPEV